MGWNFNDFDYPWVTDYQDDPSDSEAHTEPASQVLKSLVEDAEHPLFSPAGLKNYINLNRSVGNTKEKLIEGDIDPKVIKDMLDASYKNKFPFDILAFAVDFVQKLDERSSAGDAQGLVGKLTGYAEELKGVLGRQPLNSEVFAASVLENAGMVKTILEKAISAPTEDAVPLGTKADDIVFYKQKIGENVIRNNKEVYHFFKNRMNVGSDVFPWLPLGSDRRNV